MLELQGRELEGPAGRTRFQRRQARKRVSPLPQSGGSGESREPGRVEMRSNAKQPQCSGTVASLDPAGFENHDLKAAEHETKITSTGQGSVSPLWGSNMLVPYPPLRLRGFSPLRPALREWANLFSRRTALQAIQSHKAIRARKNFCPGHRDGISFTTDGCCWQPPLPSPSLSKLLWRHSIAEACLRVRRPRNSRCKDSEGWDAWGDSPGRRVTSGRAR